MSAIIILTNIPWGCLKNRRLLILLQTIFLSRESAKNLGVADINLNDSPKGSLIYDKVADFFVPCGWQFGPSLILGSEE